MYTKEEIEVLESLKNEISLECRIAMQISKAACERHMSDTPEHYHSYRHIVEMTELLDHLIRINKIGMFPDTYATLYCAIMFHDIVYCVGCAMNEKLSSIMATRFLKPVLSPNDLERVTLLIESTEIGSCLLGTIYQSDLLHDLDWAAFAEEEDCVERNTELLFTEYYDSISDGKKYCTKSKTNLRPQIRQEFMEKHIVFLKSIPDPLFLSFTFQSKNEIAKTNITNEISRLSKLK